MQPVPVTVFRLVGVVAHQLVGQLIRRLGLAQTILETVPQRLQYMLRSLAQPVLLQIIVDRP